ncbi:PQQ-binding-like beta-propeller repeat protein [Streptomyces sp. NPDC048208]|uniref:outer membrane protein assembly factor BamB family protein n=1 Tax=Streptomyces sp. NPDC048208 TaxID=3365515 RepID=UPI003718E9F2
MSQPPPGQPPHGGFGPPQNQPPQGQPPQGQPPQGQPAPGGFGAPQQQPPQGGFGAPQQPQPGYGYPQQPPGPYAQPGPYGQAPGPYGPPPGAPYGTYPQPPHPGAPGKPPGRKRTALVAGAVAAALLLVGGTVYAVTSGGGDDGKPVAHPTGDTRHSAAPTTSADTGDGKGDGREDAGDLNAGRKPGEAKVLWYKSAPDAPADGADAPGLWVTGKTAVKAAYKEVVGLRVADGTPAWDPITLPHAVCAATQRADADGKVVVAYMNGVTDRAKCNQLQQIDLDTGRKGWHAEVPDGTSLFDSTRSIELTFAGKTLMVGRDLSGTAYDAAGGRKLYDAKKYGSDCYPAGYAGDPGRLIQVASCGAGGAKERDEIRELDPATGKVKWTRTVTKGWRVERVFSVNPLVVYLTNRDKKAWNISSLDGGGRLRSEVKVDEKFAPGCGWSSLRRGLQNCRGVAVDARTLYLPTESTTGANEIVAIGLADGKEKWRVKSPVAGSMVPLRLQGGDLVAYADATYTHGGRVLSIPTGSGAHRPVTLLQNPDGAAQIENGFFDSVTVWSGGRFFIATNRLSGQDDGEEKLMMAYGK